MKLATGQVWKNQNERHYQIMEVGNTLVTIFQFFPDRDESATLTVTRDVLEHILGSYQLVEWYADFDRFDICEAYMILEWDYNKNGWLQERPSNQRRREAISVQLARLQFKPSPLLGSFEDLTDNGRAIYWNAVKRLGLPEDYS